MKKIYFRASLALSLALSHIAYGTPMKNPDVKLNPNPKMRYQITMTIKGAPGPFDHVEGSVDYKVTNEHCVPMQGFEGVTIAPEKRLPIRFQRVSADVYTGEVLVDALLDEDYYGMGVCHWSLVAAGASLLVNHTDVVPAIFHDDLLAQRTVERYYANYLYFNKAEKYVDDGNKDRAWFKEPEKTYSIAIKAEEKIK